MLQLPEARVRELRGAVVDPQRRLGGNSMDIFPSQNLSQNLSQVMFEVLRHVSKL